MTQAQMWWWLAGLALLEVIQETRRALERRSDRTERERFARLLAARNVTDAAVAEKILARPPPKPKKPAGPSAWDDIYGTKQPEE